MAAKEVDNTACPPTTAMLEPPAMGAPLSKKVTVPRLPGDGVMVAVSMLGGLSFLVRIPHRRARARQLKEDG